MTQPPLQLKPYSLYVKKSSTEPPLAQSSKGDSHSLNHTTPFPHFPQASPGDIRTWSCPVTPSKITTSTNKVSYSLIEPQQLPCTQACG